MLAVMRYQGKIVEWNDARGFGFAVPNGGGVRAFVHISALQQEQRRPRLDDAVIYEVQTDARGRPRAINVVLAGATKSTRIAIAGRTARPTRGNRHASRRGSVLRTVWRGVVLAIILIALLDRWRAHELPSSLTSPAAPEPSTPLSLELPQPRFSCQGKTRCPQMSSCAEATFYLQHCPGVKIDGDGDGIPCEDQHCVY